MSRWGDTTPANVFSGAKIDPMSEIRNAGILTTSEVYWVKDLGDDDYVSLKNQVGKHYITNTIQDAIDKCVSDQNDYVMVCPKKDGSAWEMGTAITQNKVILKEKNLEYQGSLIMRWVVEILYNEGILDPRGENIRKEIEFLGIGKVEKVNSIQTYILEGDIEEKEVKRICEELLTDNQTQNYKFFNAENDYLKQFTNVNWMIEVRFLPGVMDAVGLSTENAIKVLGINDVKVKTGLTYALNGKFTEDEVINICKEILANELIQKYSYEKIGE